MIYFGDIEASDIAFECVILAQNWYILTRQKNKHEKGFLGYSLIC